MYTDTHWPTHTHTHTHIDIHTHTHTHTHKHTHTHTHTHPSAGILSQHANVDKAEGVRAHIFAKCKTSFLGRWRPWRDSECVCVCVCVCVMPPVTDFTGGEAAHCPLLCPHTLCIITFPVGPYKSARAQLKIAFSMSTPTSARAHTHTHTHTHTHYKERKIKNTVRFSLNVYLSQQTAV